MEILEIKPNERIGQIKLGMERQEVYRILNCSADFNATAEWIGSFHIEYKIIK